MNFDLQKTDMCLYARDHDVPAAEAAPWVGLTTEQVERVYAMIDSKREAARYLHAPPLLSNAMTTESQKFCW